MELIDKKLCTFFVDLCNSLGEGDVQTIDCLLSIIPDHRWPKLQPLTSKALLMTMRERGLWKVDPTRRECHLSFLSDLLEIIGRKDLSEKVKEFG